MWIFVIIHLLIQNVVLFANQSEGNVGGAPIINGGGGNDEAGFAASGQFPFFATLFLDGYYRCGGSILSKNYILTAAHCFYNYTASQIQAVVGIVEIVPNATGSLHNATRLILHPNYVNATLVYDIALVKVGTPMTLNTSTIDSIQLTDMEGNYPANTTATVVGYSLNISAPNDDRGKLKYGLVFMHTEDQCNADLSPNIYNHTICGTNYLARASVCPGDSGGPLIIDHKLFGIISRYFICGTNIPAIFVRVNYFRSWIMNHLALRPAARGTHWKLVNGTLTVN